MIGWQLGYVRARSLESRANWPAAAKVYERLVRFGTNTARVNYRLGHVYFMQSRYDDALAHITDAIRMDDTHPEWSYRLGFIYERQENWIKAIEAYHAALANAPTRSGWLYRLGRCQHAAGDDEAARTALNRAIELEPDNSKFHDALRETLTKHTPQWRRLQILEKGASLHEDDFGWTSDLASSYFAMNKLSDAAGRYSHAASLKPNDAWMHFRAGDCYQRIGDQRANQHFQRAIESDTKLNSKQYGIGVFYQAESNWRRAAEEYREALDNDPGKADLHYRLGFALDRNYDWRAAADEYQLALELQPNTSTWSYRLGFVNERSHHFRDAEAAYTAAIAASTTRRPYWLFRLAYVQRELGKSADSARSFAQAGYSDGLERLSHTSPDTLSIENSAKLYSLLSAREQRGTFEADASNYQKLAEQASKLGFRDIAIDAYKKAIDRASNHSPDLYNALGVNYFKDGAFTLANESFISSRIFKEPYGVDERPYTNDPKMRATVEYLEHYRIKQIDPFTILYESNLGSSVDCNPLALYQYLIADRRFNKYTHVWAVNETATIPDYIVDDPSTIVIEKESDLYRRYLCTAKFLINNSTFPTYFTRKPGQYYLNTWHGTPIKRMGFDIRSPDLQHGNVSRNFLQATHLITPNEHTTEAIFGGFRVKNSLQAKVAQTGYPRIDVTLSRESHSSGTLRSRLGIGQDDNRPIVLFAPTWRGSMDERNLDNHALGRALNAFADDRRILLVRGHHYTERQIEVGDLNASIVPRSITTNELLSVTDVLITDYSSLLFDYLPLRRPIIFYLPDRIEYDKSRGLYPLFDALPGAVCETIESASTELGNVLSRFDPRAAERFDSAIAQFAPMEDGNAAARTVDFFFFGDDTHEFAIGGDHRSRLLFRHGMNPNGMTSSLINLISALDPDRYQVTLLTETSSGMDPAARAELIDALPRHVDVVLRTGHQAANVEERRIQGLVNRNNGALGGQQDEIYFDSFRREFRRLFGDTPFDTAIEFDGYSPFMGAIVLGAPDTTRKVLYLHNEMLQEYIIRFPHMGRLLSFGSRFDSLVSVSQALARKNRDDLAERFAIPGSSFTSSDNVIQPERIQKLATETPPDDVSHFISDAGFVFVVVARLSPEKNHSALLEAFSKVLNSYATVNPKLLILGDGPLVGDLEQFSDSLGLESHVLFAGQQPNPFSILKHCDCFVLPSFHEGQPMVLLEALTLGIPVVASDIIGNRGILGCSLGRFVDTSSDGICAGLEAAISSAYVRPAFDPQAYVANALSQFDDIVRRGQFPNT